MIVEGQKVIVTWGNRNKTWFLNKSYNFTKIGDSFEVNIEDITQGTRCTVQFICDFCFGKNQVTTKDKFKKYQDLIRYRKSLNKDCCNHKECKSKKKSEVLSLKPIPTELSVAIKYPHLLVEWDYEKNEKTPYEYKYGSRKIVYWKCKKGHGWDASIGNRTIGNNGCPYCAGVKVCLDNSLGYNYPHLVDEWHTDKNGTLTPYDVTPRSMKKVWWFCKHGHEWKTTIDNRFVGKGCPYCTKRIINNTNCLATTNKELLLEWNYEKNSNFNPELISTGLSENVWWVCKKGHEWEASVNSRANSNTSCPYCAGIKVCIDNSLAYLNPEIAKSWDKTKNGSLTPFDVTVGSGKKVWWLCEKNHEYQSPVWDRVNNKGCPYCLGKRVNIENCLATIFPDIAKEWHPTKNGELTPFDFTSKSNKSIWWIGECNHEWKTKICNRTVDGNNCPFCSESRGEKAIRFYLENNKFNFIPEFTFDELRGLNGGLLRFDFAMFNKNNKLTCLIEYDGEFHYEKRYNDDDHELIIEHDKRKNQYCKDNHIPLLRIPYWEFDNIEILLGDFLKD